MKKLITLFAFALIAIFANAQSPDSSQATVVHYNFSQIIDTTQQDAPNLDDSTVYKKLIQ